MRATAAAAADIDGAGHAPGREVAFNLVADLGANAHQVAPRRLRIARAKRQLHAGFHHVGHGHGLAAGV